MLFTILAWRAKKSFADYTRGLNVAIHTPRYATTLAPAKATSGFGDTLLKALTPYSL